MHGSGGCRPSSNSLEGWGGNPKPTPSPTYTTHNIVLVHSGPHNLQSDLIILLNDNILCREETQNAEEREESHH